MILIIKFPHVILQIFYLNIQKNLQLLIIIKFGHNFLTIFLKEFTEFIIIYFILKKYSSIYQKIFHYY